MRTLTPLPTCSTIVERARVRHLGGDLHAAVHRAGVHDDRVTGQAAHAIGRRLSARALLRTG